MISLLLLRPSQGKSPQKTLPNIEGVYRGTSIDARGNANQGAGSALRTVFGLNDPTLDITP